MLTSMKAGQDQQTCNTIMQEWCDELTLCIHVVSSKKVVQFLKVGAIRVGTCKLGYVQQSMKVSQTSRCRGDVPV